jgi:hypothetical protein
MAPLTIPILSPLAGNAIQPSLKPSGIRIWAEGVNRISEGHGAVIDGIGVRS